jgi:predicted CXXCH cytochrome family protein
LVWSNLIFILIFVCIFILVLLKMDTFGGSIFDTKHNLSVTGPGPIKAVTEDEVCIFCHTPHKKGMGIPYRWNRSETTVSYIPYGSSTLYATVGQPTGASKLCLSCHDGTIALGALISEPTEIQFVGGIRFMPEGPTKLGTDLSDDHPVSFVYDSLLAISNGELADPSTLPPQIKLDKDKQLQCTACHDPHNDINGKFLVMLNINSDLCTACHQKDGWIPSSHSTSNATWNGVGTDPWQHTPYTTVSENACENCHMPHTAGGYERLLNYSFEEDNCLVCHNANVASTNIETELTKPYIHAVQNYTGIHDPAEDFPSDTVQKHVECEDCHNPHWTNANPSPGAPRVSGAIDGVTGIDASGLPIGVSVNQYEICFKCHSDNNVITTVPIDRQIQQLNTRLEFAPANPSYHPVEGIGKNPNVPSLLPPYTTSSVIFCTDCHNNDNTLGPQGPHGSNYKYLLEKNYTTLDNTTESSYNYAMCYKCHDRNSILNDESFKGHRVHIIGDDNPCSACHDAHGISSTQGNSTNNSHLINFDITIVQPDNEGRLYFEDLGTLTGRCYLNCHGKPHEPLAYP